MACGGLNTEDFYINTMCILILCAWFLLLKEMIKNYKK